MLSIDDYNKGLIYTEIKNCINCNKCIRGCPVLKANVSVMNNDNNYKICVDKKECILCGTCLHTCNHSARHYRDDCETFFEDIKQGKSFSVLVAPSFYLHYPANYKQIFGYLKSLGVKNFYPVSFGADITTWGYLNYITKNNAIGKIAQPCPSIVAYIEMYLPELLPNIIPVQSPLVSTAIYLKRYKGVQEDLVFLSPCIAKKIEIESKRGLGLVRHNVTFKNLMDHVKRNNVDISSYPSVDESIEYGMGSLFPKSGGLRENIEYYLGSEASVLHVEGEIKAYQYLRHFADRVSEQSQTIPDLIDIVNCHKSCSYGTGTEFHWTNNDDVDYQSILARKKKYNALKDRDQKALNDPAQRFAQLNKIFKDLKLEDFMCGYEKNETVCTRVVTDSEIEAIFQKDLLKFTTDEKEINCLACGYKTCRNMAKAIALDINHRDNCVYYVKNSLKENVEKIRISEEGLRIIIDNMPLGCYIRNKNFEILDCNQETLNLFNLNNHQEYKKIFFKLFPALQPDGQCSIEKSKLLNERTFETGKTSFEWLYLKSDEEPIPCEVTLIRIYWKGEYCVLGFIRDLREFYKTKKNTQMMQQRLKAMLDASPILCAIYDENYKIIEANQAAADLFGLTDKQIYADRLLDLCPEFQPDGISTRDKMPLLLKLAFEKGKAQFEWMHQTLDGTTLIPCEVHLVRVNLGEKNVVMAYVRDLREQKNMLADIKAALDKAQSASSAKSRFLANMSHEIRTPMNAIIGMTSIAKNSGDIDRKDYCLDKIEKASSHLLGIINQILDMSKIEADKFKLHLYPFEFKKMLTGIINVLGFHIDEKQLDFKLNLDENIPQFITSDELRLTQVITNLMINAIKFTPKDGKVTLSASLPVDVPNTLRIEVVDTGIGISEKHQSLLFEAFEQAETETTRQYGGTGLGLAISKRIVEMLGGKIWVESELGKGSRFIFTIFIESAIRADLPDAQPEEADHYCFKGYTILVAEDMEINREIIMAVVEPTGITAEYAENGIQAVQMFRDAPDRYDIIFMDVQMPLMDGITATRKIRELNTPKSKSIPIIAMTANVFQEDIELCLAAGMSDHLGKPIDFELVLKKLRQHLRE